MLDTREISVVIAGVVLIGLVMWFFRGAFRR